MRTAGELIYAVRRRKGLSLREAAALSGVSAALLNRIENERRPLPALGRLQAIATALGMTAAERNELERHARLAATERHLAAIGPLDAGDVVAIVDLIHRATRRGNPGPPASSRANKGAAVT